MINEVYFPGWVYDFDDYCQMFCLTDEDLQHAILDFPAGISSFNAQAFAKGYRVVSADAFYSDDTARVSEHMQRMLASNKENLLQHQNLVIENHVDIEQIFQAWETRAEDFIQDFSAGYKENRYQQVQPLQLPFSDHAFKLGICSDFLFHSLAKAHANLGNLLSELTRVAQEVRFFPLLDEHGQISSELGPIMLDLQHSHFGVEVKEVQYQQLKGSNAMLRVWATECIV